VRLYWFDPFWNTNKDAPLSQVRGKMLWHLRVLGDNFRASITYLKQKTSDISNLHIFCLQFKKLFSLAFAKEL
jgi:hypothetical protein